MAIVTDRQVSRHFSPIYLGDLLVAVRGASLRFQRRFLCEV
jgi:hypothetical protein